MHITIAMDLHHGLCNYLRSSRSSIFVVYYNGVYRFARPRYIRVIAWSTTLRPMNPSSIYLLNRYHASGVGFYRLGISHYTVIRFQKNLLTLTTWNLLSVHLYSCIVLFLLLEFTRHPATYFELPFPLKGAWECLLVPTIGFINSKKPQSPRVQGVSIFK